MWKDLFPEAGGIHVNNIGDTLGITRIIYPERCEFSRDSATYYWPEPDKDPVFAGYEESDFYYKKRLLEAVSKVGARKD